MGKRLPVGRLLTQVVSLFQFGTLPTSDKTTRKFLGVPIATIGQKTREMTSPGPRPDKKFFSFLSFGTAEAETVK